MLPSLLKTLINLKSFVNHPNYIRTYFDVVAIKHHLDTKIGIIIDPFSSIKIS